MCGVMQEVSLPMSGGKYSSHPLATYFLGWLIRWSINPDFTFFLGEGIGTVQEESPLEYEPECHRYY